MSEWVGRGFRWGPLLAAHNPKDAPTLWWEGERGKAKEKEEGGVFSSSSIVLWYGLWKKWEV